VTDILRVAALIIVALAAVAAYSSGLLDRESLRILFTESGAMGPVLFITLFSLIQPFGFPGVAFMLLSVFLWPLWFAFLLNLAGATGSGVVGFAFARFIGRDWVEDRLPKRLRNLEERVLEREFRTVLIVRLTLYLFQPAHWALGLSPVRFGPFFWATLIGFIPMTAFWTFAGGNALDWLSGQSEEVWFGLAGVLVASVAILTVRRRQKTARAAESSAD